MPSVAQEKQREERTPAGQQVVRLAIEKVNQGTTAEPDSSAQQQQQHEKQQQQQQKAMKRRGSPRADQARARVSHSHREPREIHRERLDKEKEREAKEEVLDTSPSPRRPPSVVVTAAGSVEAELRVSNPLWQPRRELARLLCRHHFAVLSALCDAVQAQHVDTFARCLYTVCEVELPHRVQALMQWAVARELATQHADQLFRSGTVSTRLLSLLFRSKGAAYLYAVVQPLVRRLQQMQHPNTGEAEVSLELDPARASGLPPGVLAARQQRLCALARELLEEASRHVLLLPPEIRRLFVYAEKHHAKQLSTVMGAVFFLRFLCPPIVSPDGYRLCSSNLSAQLRRSLVLVSKLLQSLANAHLVSGSNPATDGKEPYMFDLTRRFIEEHASHLQALYARLLQPEQTPAPSAPSVQRSSSLPSTEVLAVADTDAAVPPSEAVATINYLLKDLRGEVTRILPRHLGVEDGSGAQGSLKAYSDGLRALPSVKRAVLDSLHAELAHHHLTVGHSTSSMSGAVHSTSSPRSEAGVPTREQLLESELRLMETKLRAETRTRRALEGRMQEMRAQLEEQNRLLRTLAQRLSRHEEVPQEFLAFPAFPAVPSPRDETAQSDPSRVPKSRSEGLTAAVNKRSSSRASIDSDRGERKAVSLAPLCNLTLSSPQPTLKPPVSGGRIVVVSPASSGSSVGSPLRRQSI